jgi:hypothetical protein
MRALYLHVVMSAFIRESRQPYSMLLGRLCSLRVPLGFLLPFLPLPSLPLRVSLQHTVPHVGKCFHKQFMH